MATQAQLAQISAQLKAAQQQATKIASQIGVLTQAKQAGMTITPQTTVQQAQAYLKRQVAAPSAPSALPTPTLPQVQLPQFQLSQIPQFQLPQITGQQIVQPVQIPAGELPAQTYQRVTGQPWPGGTSPQVVSLLKQYGITAKPGTAEANLALQRALVGQAQPTALPRQLVADQQALDLYREGLVKTPEVPERVSEIEKLFKEFKIPTPPPMVDIYGRLRTQYAVDVEEQELARVRQQIASITNLYEAAIMKEEERYAPISVIRRRQERLSRDMQIELSALTRRESSLIDSLNQKNKVISDLMQLYRWDYEQARNNYVAEFQTKFQILNWLRGEEREEENKALSRWTTLMNAAKDVISSGRATWETLPSSVRFDLDEEAVRGGMPSGISEWILKNTPIEKQIAFHTTSPDGTEIMIYYKDGTFEIARPGWKPKVTETAEEVARVSKVSDFIEARKGDDGLISAETYVEAYGQWANMGGTLSSFLTRFPATELMGDWEIKRLPIAFRPTKKDMPTIERELIEDIEILKREIYDVAKDKKAAREKIRQKLYDRYKELKPSEIDKILDERLIF